MIGAAKQVIIDYPPSSSEEVDSDLEMDDGVFFDNASGSIPASMTNTIIGSKWVPKTSRFGTMKNLESTVWENNGGLDDEIKSR